MKKKIEKKFPVFMALLREFFSVRSGIQAFQSHDVNSFAMASLLTRNIHKMEKGLSYGKRRSVFGEGYVFDTVKCFQHQLNHETDKGVLQWAYDVLSAYFEIVDHSKSLQVQKSYDLFKSLQYTPLNNSVKYLPMPHKDIKKSALSYSDFDSLCAQRKSVRFFKDKKVSRRDIEKAIELGLTAPSACNRQAFKLEIMTEKDQLDLVTGIPMGTSGFAEEIPCFVAIIGDQSAYFDARDRHLIYIDGSLFAMNFILALETLGLSSCIINWSDMPESNQKLKEKFRMKDYEQGVMFIAIGYADPSKKVLCSKRRSVHKIIRGYNNVYTD